MGKTKETINFEHKGIGHVLANNRLMVPINQRSYAWETEHIVDLFQDLADAIATDEAEYFLGTIVLTQGETNIPEIADGQQRLATTTILLAAIRDYLYSNNNKGRAETIAHDYLLTSDLMTEDMVPRLQLNVEDNEFFSKYVLPSPDSKDRKIRPTKPSHIRIQTAAKLAAEHIEKIVSPYKDEDRFKRLIAWVMFIREGASVILIRVPEHINAYTMFETLNDRGLRVAQSDILKNFLFGKAKERLREVQPKWASMVGALETVGDDDLTVTYIRHFWITKDGPTKERELAQKIKDSVTSKQRAVETISALDESVPDYVALLNPDHEKWNPYGNKTRKHIGIIAHQLRVEQIRPLMFAVSRFFTKEEARKAFRLFVCWSVRFLVVGGRGGLLDRNYAIKAQQVGNRDITTAKQLASSMVDVVPTDTAFEGAFATARVTQNYLARYYLRALELQIKQDPEPELVPNEEEEVINLEHILPLNPSPAWKVDSEIASACFNRIGNMVLLQAKVNVAVGNETFSKKRPHYTKSTFLLTKQVGKAQTWDLERINERQKHLANLAVKTWSLTVS